MPKFRKKPVVIEAVQLRWDNWGEMCEHAGVGSLEDGKPMGCFIHRDEEGNPTGHEAGDGRQEIGLWIPTLEGLMLGCEGDWIIRGVKGEFYPCKPDIFAETYEPVVEEEPTITFQVGDVVYTKVPYSMPLEEAVAKGLCVVEEDPAITYAKAVINGLREEK